ncbi:MAG: hypothetical protein KF745_11370 [Phycisphaeraceae bacterium]|nr:hypothetical protein [Phycisphaeraceae bacterium]
MSLSPRQSLSLPLVAAATALLWSASVLADQPALPGSNAPAATASRGPHSSTYHAKGGTLVASLSDTSPSCTDKLVLTLTAAGAPGSAVLWPDVPSDLGGFTVSGTTDSPPTLARVGDRAELQQVSRRTYVLAPYLPGDYRIPPLKVQFKSPGHDSVSISTDPISVLVRSEIDPQGDPPDPSVLREVVSLPAESAPPWLWLGVAGAGVAAIAIAAAIASLRNRRRAQPIDLLGLLTGRLRALDASLQQAPVRPLGFYIELSAVLREYLSLRFQIPATEMTTQELATRLDSSEVPAADRPWIIPHLSRSDEAKFGGEQFGIETLRDDCRRVAQFIETTHPDDNDPGSKQRPPAAPHGREEARR